jgi:hypothetical protein
MLVTFHAHPDDQAIGSGDPGQAAATATAWCSWLPPAASVARPRRGCWPREIPWASAWPPQECKQIPRWVHVYASDREAQNAREDYNKQLASSFMMSLARRGQGAFGLAGSARRAQL